MKIELTYIKIADLIQGYTDNQEDGVTGYGGRLDIRPKYQRNFIYDDEKKFAVIDTVRKGFPLNVMYWVKKEDGTFEVLDGQQRTMSICTYANGEFAVDWDGDLRGYSNLTPEQKNSFLNYELLVYICEGTDKEKLDWFQVINIAGEKLEEQEIRNAIYSGDWVTDAKRHFSRTGCPAKGASDGYVEKKWLRQQGLQTAIQWIAMRDKISINEYMLLHQHDTNCNELWLYFLTVVNWAKATFPNKKHKELKSIDWGKMYLLHKDDKLDPVALEKEVSELLKDDEIESKVGIFWYVLDHNLQNLNLRAFSEKVATEVYEAQHHHCANPNCPKGQGYEFDFSEMEADHIVPWVKGGLTIKENCQMLCRECNRRKSSK